MQGVKNLGATKLSKQVANLAAGQGSKKVQSNRRGQVSFPIGKVTYYSQLPIKQRPRQVVCQLNKKKVHKICPGQAKFESCLSKGQAGIQDFSKPFWRAETI